MIAHPQFGSPSFQLAAKGLIALHRLMKDGKDDSPEAEAIRDALDVPLHALNPIEDKRAQWLSEDLYSVSEPETAPPRDGSDSRVDKQMADVRGAIENRDWDRALFLIRDVKDSISPDLLSCVRGTIWLEAGSGDVAQVFFEHALEIDPSNSNAQALHLRSLSKSDLARARQTANAILTDDERYAPLVVAQAAYIRFEEAAAATIGESIRLRHELVPVLERTLGRFEPDETNPGRASACAMTAYLLGFCLEILGRQGAALHYYTLGIQADPVNGELLLARGILRYGRDPQAIFDLEAAVRLGSDIVLPYVFLAHHYLLTNQYERCCDTCEKGAQKQGSRSAKSHLEQWRAVAQAELGFAPDKVRAVFEAAIQLDPSNELAKRNLELFEANLDAKDPHQRKEWEQRSSAGLSQLGLAERLTVLAA